MTSVIGSVVPGTDSTSARAAARREEILSPMTSMASGGGPIHATPAPMSARAKSAFSEKKPYPGCTPSAPDARDGVEDRFGVEVTLGRGLASERVRLVGVPDVLGVAVQFGIHGDRRDSELAARAHHADRDLTSVRDQDLRQHV